MEENIVFYRIRLMDMFKKLLSGKGGDEIPSNIVASYQRFVEKSIDYFQLIDRNDIIQAEFEIENIDVFLNDKLLSDSIPELKTKVIHKDTIFFEKAIIKKKSKNPKIIIPLAREINLKDPQLRLKNINDDDDEIKNEIIYNNHETKIENA
jgi:hypothetical protein